MSHHNQTAAHVRILICCLLVVGGFTGCDDDTLISPFSGRNAHFSIYGYISHTDTHYVRVSPIRNTVERSKEPVTASFTVRSVSRLGSEVEWQQVLPFLDDGSQGLMFSDSTFGHVFRAVFTPRDTDTYTLEVTDSAGNTSAAEVTAPSVRQPIVGDTWMRNDSVFQTIILPEVFGPPLEMKAGYRLASPLFYAEIQHPLVFIDYTGKGYETDAGWRIDMDLASDVDDVRQFVADNISNFSPLSVVEDPETISLASVDMRFRLVRSDSMWSSLEQGLVNTTNISQPGAFSNVTDGFGFVGATGTNIVIWQLPFDSTRTLIGFDG